MSQLICEYSEQQINIKTLSGAIKVTGFCLVGVILAYMNIPEPSLDGTPLTEVE